jgi:putative transposase
MGVFNKIFAALAANGGKPDQPMIEATHRKAQRTAASLLKMGYTLMYRVHQRRPELETPWRLRSKGPATGHAAH